MLIETAVLCICAQNMFSPSTMTHIEYHTDSNSTIKINVLNDNNVVLLASKSILYQIGR